MTIETTPPGTVRELAERLRQADTDARELEYTRRILCVLLQEFGGTVRLDERPVYNFDHKRTFAAKREAGELILTVEDAESPWTVREGD